MAEAVEREIRGLRGTTLRTAGNWRSRCCQDYISFDEVMRRTAVRVNKVTEGRQSPWRQGDLPFDVFLAGMRSLPIP